MKKKRTILKLFIQIFNLLSKKSSKYNIDKFIHLSALGIENANDSVMQ